MKVVTVGSIYTSYYILLLFSLFVLWLWLWLWLWWWWTFFVSFLLHTGCCYFVLLLLFLLSSCVRPTYIVLYHATVYVHTLYNCTVPTYCPVSLALLHFFFFWLSFSFITIVYSGQVVWIYCCLVHMYGGADSFQIHRFTVVPVFTTGATQYIPVPGTAP